MGLHLPRGYSAALCAAALALAAHPAHGHPLPREAPPLLATLEVQVGQKDCSVDLDSGAPSKTGESGTIVIGSVEPGDHYIHVVCPEGQKASILVSPSAGETLKLQIENELVGAGTDMEGAELKIRLRQHIQEAVELRARGRIEEAAEHLRNARKLDPENSDLHRELGITFLLGKDWKRARIEMLEAIRNEPRDAEAFNGLGYALEKLGQIQAAIAAYQTATKLDPSDSSFRRHYFNALAKLSAQQAEKKK
jgi:tetratricopeptide (TPR) repeat protein